MSSDASVSLSSSSSSSPRAIRAALPQHSNRWMERNGTVQSWATFLRLCHSLTGDWGGRQRRTVFRISSYASLPRYFKKVHIIAFHSIQTNPFCIAQRELTYPEPIDTCRYPNAVYGSWLRLKLATRVCIQLNRKTLESQSTWVDRTDSNYNTPSNR